MADEIAISVEHVSKQFKLPHEKQSSIKGAIIGAFRHGKRSYERQQVLKDVSFEIKKGEFFGIVGRNGSGKSTLLKLLAGIYTPTKGHINVKGKLTPFIELGVGFNPELTGRENVYLNGALLGFNRTEMAAMYDDIVAFAEIEKFMDQKLKNYSSGMQVRLAFSIAIRAKSDILVLDEVLAVGDEAFQQKCIDVFENYKARKQTIVLVTHSMEVVRRFCTSAMLIDNGEIVSMGDPGRVAAKYSKLNTQSTESSLVANNESGESMLDIKLLTDDGKPSVSYKTGQKLRVKLSWPESLTAVKNIGIGIVKNSGEFIHGANTLEHADLQAIVLKDHTIEYEVELALGAGNYHIMAGLFGKTNKDIIEFVDYGPKFVVKPATGDNDAGLVRIAHDWRRSRD